MAFERLGLVKTTLLDYPGEVACVVFTPGCNMRCPYCHNPDFVNGAPTDEQITVDEFFQFLEKRKGVLGGVCITGGEPLIHSDLDQFILAIKERGFKVKLDTNGTFPERLALQKVDHIAMDIKTIPENYPFLTPPDPGSATLARRVRESIKWIKESGIPHHFRTTAVPGIVGDREWKGIMDLLEGEKVFHLSGFRPVNTLDPAFCRVPPYPRTTLESWARELEEKGINCTLRISEGSQE